MYIAYFENDTVTKLGPYLWKLVPDEIKIHHHYQFSNLELKNGQLIAVLVDSEKLLLKILVLFCSNL